MENPFLQDNAVENIVSWHMNTQDEPLTCHNKFMDEIKSSYNKNHYIARSIAKIDNC